MPELPEVETVLRGLRARVLGRRLTEVVVHNALVIHGDAERFAEGVAHRRVEALRRKGKALAIELGAPDGDAAAGRVIGAGSRGTPGACFLLVRLGMTGQLVVVPRAASLEPHTHVRIALEGGAEELRYTDARRFGRLRCCSPAELDGIFSRMGPDAPEISEAEFSRALRGRRGAIKGWLLNQQRLSGLGNIYADEALFAARIHPLAQPGRLRAPEARRLHRAVQKILKRAIELQGTSFRDYVDIEGRPGNFAPRLRVYQRSGAPCRRCGKTIRRLIIAGRGSHFCPGCQPRPRSTAQPTRKKTPR